MLKSILAVVVGYLVIVVVAVPIFALVFLAPDFAFQAGTAKTTLAFSLSTLVAGFAGALLGGWTSAKIAGASSRPTTALAVIVLGLGLAAALMNSLGEPPVERTAEQIEGMSTQERATLAREPVWYSFSTPFVGAFGVVTGGELARRKKRSR